MLPILAIPAARWSRTDTRFYTVLARFGVTKRQLGITAHGLRHQYANDRYEDVAGAPAPVRGGDRLDREVDRSARLQVAGELGHARENISTAYLGAILQQRRGQMVDLNHKLKDILDQHDDCQESTNDYLGRSVQREID